jgi:AcrR family transcriptional regulator
MPSRVPEAGNARQRSKLETRRRLLAAAATLFSRHGSQSTTIAMIAREAGVAAGTVYLHFADKAGLLEAVLTEALGELKRSLAEAASRDSARTAQQDVRQRTDGVVAFAQSRRELATILFDPGHLGTPVGREILAFLATSQAAGLADGQKKGWYRADLPPALTAPALVGSLVLGMDAWLRAGTAEAGKASPEAVSELLAGLRLRGIVA